MTSPRAGARWLRRSAMAVLLLGVAPAARAERTITGQLVYGTVRNDIGEPSPPTNLIQAGLPVPRVRVRLVQMTMQGLQTVGTRDITDVNGRFRITVPGTPILLLVTSAENDYVTVKKFMGTLQNLELDDPLDTYRNISGSIDYNTCLDGETCDIGLLTVVSDTTDSFRSVNGTYTNYISRAFYLASAAHAAGTNAESVHGAPLPGEKVAVRMGTDQSTTWYYQIPNTIFLPNNGALSFWHEYGHFLEDKIGAFNLGPPYLGPSHAECTMITDAGPGNQNPNLCWAYLEGLATWFGALNATALYGGYDAMAAAFDDDGNIFTRDDEDVEINQCDPLSWTDTDFDGVPDTPVWGTPAIFAEPRAVESIVANVIWDLLDTVQDPPNNSGVDEVATATAWEILDVITAPQDPHVSCGLLDSNSHPVGLDEFWSEWRLQHPDRLPDIFAAYAFNGADVGNAADLTAPGPVVFTDSSHTPGVWSNDPSVSLDITDGPDDLSGSYWYYVVADQSAQTAVPTSGPETFKSKYTSHQHVQDLPDGDGQYIHVNSRDMKGHQATATAHFGPVRIDTVDPFLSGPFKAVPFRIDPTVPPSDPTLMIGYPVHISWASDDALSGVAEVRITFADTTGFSRDVHTTPDRSGAYIWLVDDVPESTTGQLLITVTDQAGNDVVESIPAPTKAPFSGPLSVSLGPDTDPCLDGRVISADLQQDGFDDIVLVCRFNGTGHLYVLRGTSNGVMRVQDFPWRAADDLAAADLDRDGDLDVVTVSLAAPGVATQADILYNDGTGTLVDPGIARPLGALERKTVRIVHPYDRRAPVIAVFGALQPGDVPTVVAFATTPGYPNVALPGVAPVDGDWEAADVNGDAYVDLVALGVDVTGKEALSIFTGSSGAFSRQDVEVYSAAGGADVDVGDFDADGRPDIFAMFADSSLTHVTKLLRRGGASYSTFASAGTASRQVAHGDGFIVDTANDAKAEVVAMGRTVDEEASGWYLRNDGIVGTLQATTVNTMRPLTETDTAWGDFDADGDLDVFQLGIDATVFTFGRYENRLGTYIDQNDQPKPPTALSAVYDTVRGGYVFSWQPPAVSIDETPVAGLGYELRVGTTPNGGEILSWAHPAGASQQGFRLDRFVSLVPGVYWYSVRSVDSGWKRSGAAAAKQTTP